MFPPITQLATKGYDMQFDTEFPGIYDHLHSSYHISLTSDSFAGHYFFTELLLPALLEVGRYSSEKAARAINTSSAAAYLNPIHWDTLKDGELL